MEKEKEVRTLGKRQHGSAKVSEKKEGEDMLQMSVEVSLQAIMRTIIKQNVSL